MKKKTTLLKSLLVAAAMIAGVNGAWAGDKTVVKYSFDNATSPALTAGNRSVLDYSHTSAVTSTVFLNVYDGNNNHNGDTKISLTSDDLSGEEWTLDFYWGANSGSNNRPGYTYLKAGETNLFTITDPGVNKTSKLALTYGESGNVELTVPIMDTNTRFKAGTGDKYNTAAYWYHFVIKGTASGVKMTITNNSEGNTIISDAVLSETNVTPTEVWLRPAACGAVGIDELSLSYYVEGEVIQTPVANYTAVNGISRTITANCDTEDATIQYSTDGETYVDGAVVTVSESGKIYFKAVKGTAESDVLEFDAVAGEAIKLITPLINRTSNTEVTITADQTSLLLSPTATIYYTYGEENGSFTGSKTLTVAADDVISAYAVAEGYTTSETASRAVALFPTNIETLENTATRTSGWSSNAFSSETMTVSDRKYAALLLDDVQWGSNIYLQTDGAWGLRASGSWYINSNEQESWLLMPNMKAGDIVVVRVDYAASSMVNASYSKYTYGNYHAYEVESDGNVELAFKKINAGTMDYIYGVYAYRPITSVSATITSECGLATFCSNFALDFSDVEGLSAYIVTSTEGVATLKKVTKVPAGTGLVLEGAVKTYDVPVIGFADPIEDNLLIAATTDHTAVDGDYVLAYQSEVRAFFPAEPDLTIYAGKAYLHLNIPAGSAPAFLPFATETTGISATLKNSEKVNKEVFNLNGQRVGQPTKGLYIVGGRKVVVK